MIPQYKQTLKRFSLLEYEQVNTTFTLEKAGVTEIAKFPKEYYMHVIRRHLIPSYCLLFITCI